MFELKSIKDTQTFPFLFPKKARMNNVLVNKRIHYLVDLFMEEVKNSLIP